MSLGLLEIVGGIAFSIFVLFVFCYMMIGESKRIKEEKEKEWERIKRISARKKEALSGRSSKFGGSAYRARVRSRKKPIPGVAHSLTAIKNPPSSKTGAVKAHKGAEEASLDSKTVKALRGGEFIGNRMRFKVKVLNDSPFLIAEVTVFLISYPKEALQLSGKDKDVAYPNIEPGGFRSPKFDFLPTQDCVRGEIIAGVSYIDERGKPHLLHTKPFVIRSVCDLLLPVQIKPDEFVAKLKDLHCGELIVKVDGWTPEEMHEKALRIMEDANFYEVKSDIEVKESIVFAEIHGLAKGKYTGKSIAVEILISGPSNEKGANCTLKVSGEDEAMILPAIDDLRERLSAWLCPVCSSALSLENVEYLKEGKAVVCPFCGVSIGR